jgi:DnaA family protein
MPGDPHAADGSRQLVLRFPLVARSRFEDFVAGANLEAIHALRSFAEPAPRFRGVLLSGPAGTGKTHLLQAACRNMSIDPRGAIYLPLADAALDAAALEGLEGCALVALDDIEAWLGDPLRERVLLGLYQGLAAANGVMLAASVHGAAALQTYFPDLLSRLRALTAYSLAPLDDTGKAAVLRRLASERGLELPRPVLDYWLSRGGRELADLIAQFEQLDAAALVAQRRITVPLLKEVLNL